MLNFPVINYYTFFYNFLPDQTYFPIDSINTFSNFQNASQTIKVEESFETKNFFLTLTRDQLEKEGAGISKKHWSEQEDKLLKQYVHQYGYNWSKISQKLPERNQKMCYSRYRRIQKDMKSYWTTEENIKIKKMYEQQKKSWKQINQYFPNRSAKQIRQHYLNFLRPDIKKDEWTLEQDMKIIQLFNEYGKRWKNFQQYFEGRTQNQIKNRFYGRLKRLQIKKISQKQDKN